MSNKEELTERDKARWTERAATWRDVKSHYQKWSKGPKHKDVMEFSEYCELMAERIERSLLLLGVFK